MAHPTTHVLAEEIKAIRGITPKRRASRSARWPTGARCDVRVDLGERHSPHILRLPGRNGDKNVDNPGFLPNPDSAVVSSCYVPPRRAPLVLCSNLPVCSLSTRIPAPRIIWPRTHSATPTSARRSGPMAHLGGDVQSGRCRGLWWRTDGGFTPHTISTGLARAACPNAIGMARLRATRSLERPNERPAPARPGH